MAQRRTLLLEPSPMENAGGEGEIDGRVNPQRMVPEFLIGHLSLCMGRTFEKKGGCSGMLLCDCNWRDV